MEMRYKERKRRGRKYRMEEQQEQLGVVGY